jgi:hypothetical protein
MPDTPNTPIQPPDDDRALLRQLFMMMQDVQARLTSLEERARRTTSDLLAAFSEILKAELEPIRVEMRDLRHAFRSTYVDMIHAQQDLEERVSKLEGRPPQQ